MRASAGPFHRLVGATFLVLTRMRVKKLSAAPTSRHRHPWAVVISFTDASSDSASTSVQGAIGLPALAK